MKYLSETDVMVIHARIIDGTGGRHGVRELELLRSIIHKPQTQLSGKDMYPDIFLKAAVYLESVASSHVFIDGNKRTSIAVAVRFLAINNYLSTCPVGEVGPFVIKAVVEKLSIIKIAHWFKHNSQKG
ncbi:MAG: type II toxin-antitoxin system death-on-curing family toxin [Candidatus Taylorbacteria bacterium]|nr:type II toxin-antitoxin system death-on-curing family toxin [Candidatus Taylorbacteria bacterium]